MSEKELEISKLRSAILNGMSISAEKLKRKKRLLGQSLVVSDNGKVKLILPEEIK
jgi:hypothetical protein